MVVCLIDDAMKKCLILAAAALFFLLTPALAQQQPLNKKNLVVKEWNTDVRTNHKVLDHVTTFGPDGRKMEEIEYGSSGQKWRKRFEYGVDGRRSKEYVYNEHNRLDHYKTFEYNEFGKRKKQTTYNSKGKVVSIKIFEYIAQDAE